MKPAKLFPFLGATFLLALVCGVPGHAQFFPGVVSLPRADFTWVWGDERRAAEGRTPDIRLMGYDAGFQCDLTTRFRPGSRLSRMDIRELENDIRTSLSFIEAAAYAMSSLDYNREIDWAKLDCVRITQDETASVPAPEAVEAWIELEVRLREAAAGPDDRDYGQWAVNYVQQGTWRLRRSGGGRRASYTIRPQGLLLPSSLEALDATGYEVCYDRAGREWRTDLEEPAEAQPMNLTTSNESGELVLWATVPEAWMQHPGHGSIPADSSCHAIDAPRRQTLSLDLERLAAAGAPLDGNTVRLETFGWDALAAAALGNGPEATFSISHQSTGPHPVELEIRGTISQPQQ